MVSAIAFTTVLVTALARSGGEAAFSDTVRESLAATGDYLASLLRGDLGLTVGVRSEEPREVAEVLSRTFPKSLGLLVASLLVATAIGLPLGILAALRRHSRLSAALLSVSTLGISAPSFFIALLLLIPLVSFYRSTGIRLVPAYGFGWDRHLILPALVLAARPAAAIARLAFIAVAEVLEKDYVRTAHSKGLPPRSVLLQHALRNAAVPLLSSIGSSLRLSLSILPVVEFFFSWPGVGLELLEAIRRFDPNLVTALVLSLAVTFLALGLILDLLYRAFDPKLREPAGAG